MAAEKEPDSTAPKSWGTDPRADSRYAFLKLHQLTGEATWLDRAQAFAMHAIEQCRAARTEHGRGRYSLWTGDVGLACYLHECLRGSARFPTADVF